MNSPVLGQYRLVDAFPGLPAFSQPVEMRTLAGTPERIFIVEQRGRIYEFVNDSSVSARRLFLDLSDIVSQTGGETGLLGLAFDPHFDQDGFFYVDFTSSREGRLRSYISRFQVSPITPDSALHSSEQVVIAQDKPFENHNGGNLVFGPDGYLYINWGDGGSAGDPFGNAQNRSSLLGKILRIDVDTVLTGSTYSIPPSNPFAGNTQGYRGEIYAYGLRNPWRMSFDRATGTIWVGDVGQDTWEEVDTITAGGNYGWNIMEGYACYNPASGCDSTGLIPPLWVYDHSNGDKAITGGYVYRGSMLPELTGDYLFADYQSGRIWAYDPKTAAPAPVRLLIDTPYLISSFGEDGAGELYILSYQDGRLYRISRTPAGIAGSCDASMESFELFQNFPNPFNPTTMIAFRIRETGFVRLCVYDINGRLMETLLNGIIDAGTHSVVVSVDGWTSGVYFYRLQSGNHTQQRSMTVLK